MRLLLDTHTLIWFGENSPELSSNARNAIEQEANLKFVSAATFWEMAIKISIGKLHLTKPLSKVVREIEESQFIVLPILATHTLNVESLPLLHRDPFDRMLLAQALAEDFTLISNEVLFDRYGIKRLW